MTSILSLVTLSLIQKLTCWRAIGDWDVFEENPWENFAHADRDFWSRVHAISRVVFCIFLLLFTIFTSSISVLSVLIIAFNINATSKAFALPSGQVLRPPGEHVDVRWVWAAILVMTAPYIFTFCKCMMRLSLKRTRSLTWRPLLLVSSRGGEWGQMAVIRKWGTVFRERLTGEE